MQKKLIAILRDVVINMVNNMAIPKSAIDTKNRLGFHLSLQGISHKHIDSPIIY